MQGLFPKAATVVTFVLCIGMCLKSRSFYTLLVVVVDFLRDLLSVRLRFVLLNLGCLFLLVPYGILDETILFP